MAKISLNGIVTTPTIEAKVPDLPPSYHNEPAEAKIWAKDAWLRRIASISKIAEHICVPDATVKSWVQGWKKELTKIEAAALEDAVDQHAERIGKTLDKVLTVIDRSAEHILESNIVLNVDQFRGFVSSAEALDNMKRKEEGKPTEIHAHKVMTWDSVLVRLKNADIVEYDGDEVKVTSVKALPETEGEWKK